MKNKIIILLFTILSCDNYNRLVDSNMDITPPTLISLNVVSSNSIKVVFNENVIFKESSFVSRENSVINDVISAPNSANITFMDNFIPGMEYCSEFRFEDTNGNSISFIAKYYGFNPSPPELVINEFICKGTKTNPDKVEIYIKKGGNMAGITLFNGVSENYDTMFIFPSMKVNSGEYIVIRSTSEIYKSEYIEKDDLNFNNDKKFIDGVRDIRTDNFSLSSANGVISIYSDPFGEIIDAVIYSKNLNDFEKSYRNFGLKKTVERVDTIAEQNQWQGISYLIFPEDTINSNRSTTTRSLNRLNFIDKNSRTDWYMVPTGKSSFGYENSKEVY